MCLLRSQKNFNSVSTVLYTAVFYDARFQANSYNCLSNNGFATFSKTGIIIYNMSNIEHSLMYYIRRTFQQRITVVSPTSRFANGQFANVSSRFANVSSRFANAFYLLGYTVLHYYIL